MKIPKRELSQLELEIVHEAINILHSKLAYDEAMDGDFVDSVVYEIKEALNDLNGNN